METSEKHYSQKHEKTCRKSYVKIIGKSSKNQSNMEPKTIKKQLKNPLKIDVKFEPKTGFPHIPLFAP